MELNYEQEKAIDRLTNAKNKLHDLGIDVTSNTQFTNEEHLKEIRAAIVEYLEALRDVKDD